MVFTPSGNKQTQRQTLLVRASCVVLVAAASLYFLVATIESINLFVPLTMSDHTATLWRWEAYMTGTIGFADFVLARMVEHNHAVAFLVGFLDSAFNHGRLGPFLVVNIGANAIFALGVLALVSRLNIGPLAVAFLAVLTASQVCAVGTNELWVHPFQIVVTVTRVLVLASFALLLYGIERRRMLYICGAAVVGLLAYLSHGSGVAAVVVMLAIALIARSWVAIVAVGIALAVGIAHDLAYPGGGPQLGTIIAAAVAALPQFPGRVAYVLGHFVTWPDVRHAALGTPATRWALAFGWVGIGAYFTLAIRIALRRDRGAAELTLIALATFALISCAMSVALNLARDAHMQLAYFVSPHYSGFTSIFWISVVALGLAATPVAARIAVFATILVSVFLSVRDASNTRVGLHHQFRDRAILMSAIITGTTDRLTIDQLARGMAVPGSFPRSVLEHNLEILRKYGLSPH